MSCSNVINAYTNAKSLYYGVNRFKMQYTCGKCAGCLSKKRTDWRVRAYYEALGCLRAGGYVLFDTLTMADDHIKRYSDIFPDMDIPQLLDRHCFSRKDVKDFFKRLRVNLTRAGYDVKDTLRYILTSEYGASETTRGFVNTHRPHYHVLFSSLRTCLHWCCRVTLPRLGISARLMEYVRVMTAVSVRFGSIAEVTVCISHRNMLKMSVLSLPQVSEIA